MNKPLNVRACAIIRSLGVAVFTLGLVACGGGNTATIGPAVRTAAQQETDAGPKVDSVDWANLNLEAPRRGFVPVMIGLERIGLSQLANSAVHAAMAKKGAALRAELGANASDAGAWNNGIGQMGLHVNQAGLAQLMQSQLLVNFMPDTDFRGRYVARDDDGSTEAIEHHLDRDGRVRIDIELNVAIAYRFMADGSTQYLPDAQSERDIAARLSALLEHPLAAGLQDLDVSDASKIGARRPQLRATVDRETYVWLVTIEHVRALRLQGQSDTRPADWDADLLATAQQSGYVDVTFTLRGSSAYSSKMSLLLTAAWDYQSQANRIAFEELLSNAQVAFDHNTMSLTADLGFLQARLSADAIERLLALRDPRILGAQGNRPIALTL